MTPASTDIDVAIDELESRLERLRSLYEQYFIGIEKIEPSVPRQDVDRRIHALRKAQIRNTAKRFKLQNIIQRYNAFQQYWVRICREIENGTYHRHVARAQSRFGDVPMTAAGRRRARLQAQSTEHAAAEQQKARAKQSAEDDLEALLAEDPETALTRALKDAESLELQAARPAPPAAVPAEPAPAPPAASAAPAAVPEAPAATSPAVPEASPQPGHAPPRRKRPGAAGPIAATSVGATASAAAATLGAAAAAAPTAGVAAAPEQFGAAEPSPALPGRAGAPPPRRGPPPKPGAKPPGAAPIPTPPDISALSPPPAAAAAVRAPATTAAAGAPSTAGHIAPVGVVPAPLAPSLTAQPALSVRVVPPAEVEQVAPARSISRRPSARPREVASAAPAVTPSLAASSSATASPATASPATVSPATAERSPAAAPAGARLPIEPLAPAPATKSRRPGPIRSKPPAANGPEGWAALRAPPVMPRASRSGRPAPPTGAVASSGQQSPAMSGTPEVVRVPEAAPAAGQPAPRRVPLPASVSRRRGPPTLGTAKPAEVAPTTAVVRPGEPHAMPIAVAAAPVAPAAPARAAPAGPAAAARSAPPAPVAAAVAAALPAERKRASDAAPVEVGGAAADARATAAAGRAAATRAAEARAQAQQTSASRLDDQRVRQLHEALVTERRRLNQPGKVSVESLASSLRDTESKLKKQYAGKDVDFHVVVKDGKAVVKPIVG